MPPFRTATAVAIAAPNPRESRIPSLPKREETAHRKPGCATEALNAVGRDRGGQLCSGVSPVVNDRSREVSMVGMVQELLAQCGVLGGVAVPARADRFRQHRVPHQLGRLDEPCRPWPRRFGVECRAGLLVQVGEVRGRIDGRARTRAADASRGSGASSGNTPTNCISRRSHNGLRKTRSAALAERRGIVGASGRFESSAGSGQQFPPMPP